MLKKISALSFYSLLMGLALPTLFTMPSVNAQALEAFSKHGAINMEIDNTFCPGKVKICPWQE